MTTTDRITINLGVEELDLDVDDVDRLVEESEASSRSELIRRLVREELDELDGSRS